MARGGARPGGGRPPKHDEDRVRDVALKAILKVHGSEEAAFEFLLQHQEASLVRFAYEHAFGKPKEKREIEGNLTGINLQIIMPDGH